MSHSEMSTREKRNNRLIAMGICVVLLLIGVVLVGISMVRAVRMNNATQVQATITNYRIATQKDLKYYAPEYTYEWEGETVTFQSSRYSTTYGEKNEQVTLYLDEEGQVLESGYSTVMMQVGVISLIMALGYAGMMAWSKRKAEQKERVRDIAVTLDEEEEQNDENE